jgi:hypothetical protein
MVVKQQIAAVLNNEFLTFRALGRMPSLNLLGTVYEVGTVHLAETAVCHKKARTVV